VVKCNIPVDPIPLRPAWNEEVEGEDRHPFRELSHEGAAVVELQVDLWQKSRETLFFKREMETACRH